MTTKVNRRQLLLGGSLALCGACATMPPRLGRLDGGKPAGTPDRACDHDLCRYWRPAGPFSPPVTPPAVGEPRAGHCSIGMPEEP